MLYKSFFLLGLILCLSLTIACSDDVNSSNNNSPITETQAVQKAQQTNPGTVTKTELTTHNGVKVYEVYMITTSGGELKIKYRVDDGTMVEMKGTSPSFDYEVDPGMNLIKYSSAKSIALNAKSGNVQLWKLEIDESDNRWEYRFFIRSAGQDSEIRINATTGVVLRIK
ncbi:MAG: PepSY domain-containing protein [Ignavibacteriaceae bacterium]|nr:PepSY domain-containing protein [Ignavibacteriaceae bacterium]